MNRYKFDKENHVHLLYGNRLTGCSTVVGVLSKPLSWWAAGKTVEAMGWIHGKPKVNGMYTTTPIEQRIEKANPIFETIKKGDVKDYIKLLDKAYKAHSVKLKESAQKGIDLHAELERFVNNEISGVKEIYIDKIQPFIEWSKKYVDHFLFSEAYCYHEGLYVGGIADAGAMLNNGEIALIDFKSSKAAYTSHFLQCAGYSIMIDENGTFDENGHSIGNFDKITKVIVCPFGEAVMSPVMKDADTFKEGFKNAVGLYRLIKSQEVG